MHQTVDQPALSLYLHIPFCRHRCAYCDFNTYTGLEAIREAYADGLVREIRQVAGVLKRPANTVFFGGGTPTLMPADAIDRILRELESGFQLAADTEVTMEANPETVDTDYLAAVRGSGVNRLSIGMQSANAGELAFLERQHDFASVAQAVRAARAAGFANVSLDLIYGLPNQTLASWGASLEVALTLEPDHLSLYALTIESGTPMHRWLHNDQIQAPDPDMAADQYELACELLDRVGFQHYEISNWARPGRACQHNLSYWRNNQYLGFGAGAHGHADGFRYEVVRQPRAYLARLQDQVADSYPWSAAVRVKEKLTVKEAMIDCVLMQLRLLQEGLDLATFQRKFGSSLREAFPGVTEELISWGLLQQVGQSLRLTPRGWLLSNQVFYRYL
ncbi:MAG: radical SAM family heme chaperone HemW [Candidatus Promineifilaceae bacterium]|nr:radical SAM family heme chaperone HemW [Candidatus Promineifilaceae bacterium]